MRKTLSTIAVAGIASLAMTAAAQAATTPVQSLSGDFTASNSTVVKTPDGVHFGTYADGGANGGSLLWKGANGTKLKDVNEFSFTFNYKQAGSLSGATPYARIWLDTNHDGKWVNGEDAEIMFDPSNGGSVTPAQQVDQTFGTADNSVRYMDDKGNGGQRKWADVVATYGNESIIMVGVSQGYSMGTDVSAMVRSIQLNDTTYAFNVPPADGQTASAGLNGRNGAPGLNGATGAPGQNGTTTIITREVPAHSPGKVCAGNNVRILRAPSRKGERFLSTRASLNGKALKISGRKMTADLRHRAEGNYNIRISSRYRTAGGKVRTMHTVRSLSVACS